MKELLDAAYRYVGRFQGIRCSTRPDAIDSEILTLLKSYKVTSIELGAQSMCDDVLMLNERGHTVASVEEASKLIKDFNISLGLQMMTGMYGSTPEKDFYTAERLAELCPDTVRIYPTITLKDTKLNTLYNSGKYVPYDSTTTVEVCAKLLKFFTQKNINVIRLGLHQSDDILVNRTAGYYHPAFREICESKIFLESITQELTKLPKGDYQISVSPRSISKAVGQKKSNVNALKNLGYSVKLIPCEGMGNFDFMIHFKR